MRYWRTWSVLGMWVKCCLIIYNFSIARNIIDCGFNQEFTRINGISSGNWPGGFRDVGIESEDSWRRFKGVLNIFTVG